MRYINQYIAIAFILIGLSTASPAKINFKKCLSALCTGALISSPLAIDCLRLQNNNNLNHLCSKYTGQIDSAYLQQYSNIDNFNSDLIDSCAGESAESCLNNNNNDDIDKIDDIESSFTTPNEQLQNECSVRQIDFEYLESNAIPFRRLRQTSVPYMMRETYLPGYGENWLTKGINSAIPDDLKLVKIGYHGTHSDNLFYIRYKGMKSSKYGYLGKGVYFTPDFEHALRVYGKDKDKKAGSVCSLFLPLDYLKQVNGYKLTATRGDSSNNDPIVVMDFLTLENTAHYGVVRDEHRIIAFCEKNIPIYKYSMVSPVPDNVDDPFYDFDLHSYLYNVPTANADKLVRQHTCDGDCPFCKKIKAINSNGDSSSSSSNDNGNSKNIKIYGDVLVFPDHAPGAKHHLLAIPKDHSISSVLKLTKSHVPLIKKLKESCQSQFESMGMDKEAISKAVYGFHIPNHISINHLHLHCLIPPFYNDMKYDRKTFAFISANELIDTLESGKSVNRVLSGYYDLDKLHLTPWSEVHKAAYVGDIYTLKELDRDSYNTVGKNGWTPVFLAALTDEASVVEYLLHNGAEADENRLFMFAASRGNFGVAKLLVNSRGVDPNVKDERGQTVLQYATRNYLHDVIEFMNGILAKRT